MLDQTLIKGNFHDLRKFGIVFFLASYIFFPKWISVPESGSITAAASSIRAATAGKAPQGLGLAWNFDNRKQQS